LFYLFFYFDLLISVLFHYLFELPRQEKFDEEDSSEALPNAPSSSSASSTVTIAAFPSSNPISSAAAPSSPIAGPSSAVDNPSSPVASPLSEHCFYSSMSPIPDVDEDFDFGPLAIPNFFNPNKPDRRTIRSSWFGIPPEFSYPTSSPNYDSPVPFRSRSPSPLRSCPSSPAHSGYDWASPSHEPSSPLAVQSPIDPSFSDDDTIEYTFQPDEDQALTYPSLPDASF
jgi:hypothetical protein